MHFGKNPKNKIKVIFITGTSGSWVGTQTGGAGVTTTLV